MSAEVININFKERIRIDKFNNLKNNYFKYLNMTSKNHKEKNRMFISDYQKEISNCTKEQGKSVEDLLTEHILF